MNATCGKQAVSMRSLIHEEAVVFSILLYLFQGLGRLVDIILRVYDHLMLMCEIELHEGWIVFREFFLVAYT